MLLGDTQHDEAREDRYALMLKRKEADGLIVLGHRLPKEAAALVRAMAPRCAPVVNGCEFSPKLGIPSVHIDNAKAAAEAMDYLYRLGHRHIGIITGPLVSPLSRDRLRGATARAKQQRAERDFVVMTGDFSIESGAVGAERLLGGGRRRPPSSASTTKWRWARSRPRSGAVCACRSTSRSSASTTSASRAASIRH